METQPLSKAAQKIIEDRKAERASGSGTQAPATFTVDPMDKLRAMIESNTRTGLCYIDPKKIIPDPTQPRKASRLTGAELENYETELMQLSGSLSVRQVQPIVVDPAEDFSAWQIIIGERRWMAAIAGELPKIAAIFLPKRVPPPERKRMQMTENIQRAGFKGIEAAEGYRDLMELFGWTQKQCAQEMKVSQATVSESLRLLDLSEPVRAKVIAGKIPTSVGAEIAQLDDPIAQEEVAEKIEREGLNREEASAEVKGRRNRPRRRTYKGSKSVTYKKPAGVVTVALKQAGGNEERIALLRQVLADLEEQQSEAA